MKTNSDPEKSWIKAGRVEVRDANQIARSNLYGTLPCEERSDAICRSSGERCGSSDAVDRNKLMPSVEDITSPGGLAGSVFISQIYLSTAYICVFSPPFIRSKSSFLPKLSLARGIESERLLGSVGGSIFGKNFFNLL